MIAYLLEISVQISCTKMPEKNSFGNIHGIFQRWTKESQKNNKLMNEGVHKLPSNPWFIGKTDGKGMRGFLFDSKMNVSDEM